MPLTLPSDIGVVSFSLRESSAIKSDSYDVYVRLKSSWKAIDIELLGRVYPHIVTHQLQKLEDRVYLLEKYRGVIDTRAIVKMDSNDQNR